MDDDHRELVRRLFAVATELIETAHDAAVAGQSGQIAAENHAENYAEAASRLQATVRDVAVLAETATIVANSSVERSRNRRKRPR